QGRRHGRGRPCTGHARSDEDGARAERPHGVARDSRACGTRRTGRARPAAGRAGADMIRAHPALTDEHEALRETMRRFVAREIAPHATAWDEAEEFPRDLYKKAAAAGLLGIGFPEEYGGTPADLFTHVILAEEIALAGVGGVHAGLFSHQIGAPPIAHAGTAALKS